MGLEGAGKVQVGAGVGAPLPGLDRDPLRRGGHRLRPGRTTAISLGEHVQTQRLELGAADREVDQDLRSSASDMAHTGRAETA